MTPIQIFVAIMGTQEMDATARNDVASDKTTQFASVAEAQSYLRSRQQYDDADELGNDRS